MCKRKLYTLDCSAEAGSAQVSFQPLKKQADFKKAAKATGKGP